MADCDEWRKTVFQFQNEKVESKSDVNESENPSDFRCAKNCPNLTTFSFGFKLCLAPVDRLIHWLIHWLIDPVIDWNSELHWRRATKAGARPSSSVSLVLVRKYQLDHFSSSPEERGKERHLAVGDVIAEWMQLSNGHILLVVQSSLDWQC